MIYLDTSVVVPLFVREPASEAVSEWFSASTDALVAADWLVTEFASALSIKVRQGHVRPDTAQQVWDEFDVLCAGGLRLLPVSRNAFAEAARLVRQADSGLRAGDSLHLAVALSCGARCLVTADGNLEANARRQGLETLRFKTRSM